MKIYTSPVPDYYSGDFYKGKYTIIVDIFRATTTMLHLFSLGVKEIFLLKDEANVEKLKAEDILKIGERFGEKLEKFDFNNSSSALLREKDKIGSFKKAAMLTTNGTKTALKASLSKKIFVGAFNNSDSVVRVISEETNISEVVISLSGDKGEISLEDTIFGGNLLYDLKKKGVDMELSDFSTISLKTYEAYRRDKTLIASSRHYNRLLELDFKEDIELALKKDIFDFVPIVKGNKVILAKSG